MKKLSYGKLQRNMKLALWACCALAATGCATMGGPERTVEARAKQYWNARIEGQPDKAYELTTPSHRQLRTLPQYRSKFPGLGAKSAEVADVTCEAERCVAKIKLNVQPGLAMVKLDSVDMYLDDVWVLEQGQWWHFEAP